MTPDQGSPALVFDGPGDAPVTVALAHGAGAPMDSDWMDAVATVLAARGLRVARFEFPYMARRRADGKRRPPDRQPVLLDCWRAVVAALGADRLVIGGKSMGGRMASLVADETGVRGLVCLGYPFHPPGKPEKTRTEHLETLRTPTLILQGERDPFGGREEVSGYRLSAAIRLYWLADGDHGFKPRKASGRTEAQNLEEAAAAVADFARGVAT
ncbi:MAG: dienelactone hydrolase family protein [Alphaproteobacteria bacterium]|nr:dienelactone hydrolase family protein [Alphaproteobacteria bacterium]